MGQPELTEPLDPPQVYDLDIPRLAYIPNKEWHAERVAFYRQLPDLLRTYRGQYVAIRGGAVVGHGDLVRQVSMDAHRLYGEVPIYIGLVSDKPVTPARIPSPRSTF
jgi:hypothetical protein